MSKNKLWIYTGPVMKFNTCVQQNWQASTYAPTEKKARANLTYRYKREHDYIKETKIDLPGIIVKGEVTNDGVRV